MVVFGYQGTVRVAVGRQTDPRTGRQWNWAIQEGVARRSHPGHKPIFERLLNASGSGAAGDIHVLIRIDRVVVKLDRRQPSVVPFMFHQPIERWGLIDIREHRFGSVAESANVKPAFGANRSLWFIGGVECNFAENLGSDRVLRTLE